MTLKISFRIESNAEPSLQGALRRSEERGHHPEQTAGVLSRWSCLVRLRSLEKTQIFK